MSKPNKDGWIRHRGGKCPVEAGVLVDVRHRDGQIIENVPALLSAWAGEVQWAHDTPHKAPGEIMAFRIHKPSEQPAPVSEPVERKCEGRACEMPGAESHSKECLLDAAIGQGWVGPLQWRDRITEIDRTVEALEEERVALVQRLEAEGFRLIERDVRPAEDMSDWRNWKAGDVIRHVDGYWKDFTKGALYQLKDVSETELFLDDDVEPRILRVDARTLFSNGDFQAFKFHSRPSK